MCRVKYGNRGHIPSFIRVSSRLSSGNSGCFELQQQGLAMQREGDSHSPASTEQRGSRTDGGALLVCDSVEVGDRVGRKRGGHAWPSGEPMSGGLPQSLLRGSGQGDGGRRKRGQGGSLLR